MSIKSSGTSPALKVGYAAIQPDPGNTNPSGVAIFGLRQNGILVTEAGVPASPLLRNGRIYAEVNDRVNTGIALANPNAESASLSFYFTSATGNFGNGSFTIPAHSQIAKFLNESPFNIRTSLEGAFTFSSSVPVAVIALRGLTNERAEFLVTSLPVDDLDAANRQDPIVFPQFVDGGGWTTEVILVNRTGTRAQGTIQFLGASGESIDDGVVAYSIPPEGASRRYTDGTRSSTIVGSVRVSPSANTTAPAGMAIFSYRKDGVSISQAGVPASRTGSAFRSYAEASGKLGSAVSIQTGIAIANSSPVLGYVTVEVFQLNGSTRIGRGELAIPPNGQTARFLSEIQGLTALPEPFQGIVRVTSSMPVSVIGLRGRYNERGDFLITTTPFSDETQATSTGPLFFPHIADSGGYTTQFILFSTTSDQWTAGTLKFFSQSGDVWDLR